VSVFPYPLLIDGTLQYAGMASIDLTSLVPGAALQCWVVVFWDIVNAALTAYASTPADMGTDVLGFDTLQECINQSAVTDMPVCAVYLADNQAILDDDETHWTDLRQVFNIPVVGFGAGVLITLAADVAAPGAFQRHLILAAESGTTDNCIEITGLAVGVEIIVRADAGDTITIKHNDAGATDKIILAGGADVALSGNMTLKLCKIAAGAVVQYVT
jgi:hypothetical protein